MRRLDRPLRSGSAETSWMPSGECLGKAGLKGRGGNVILFPSAKAEPDLDSPIACRERLGGLLNYYHRKAA
jgi:hypothetical protein